MITSRQVKTRCSLKPAAILSRFEFACVLALIIPVILALKYLEL
jgi:hypothetical protein